MKTKFTLLALFIATYFTSFAQQPPNGDFANWTNAWTPTSWVSAEDLLGSAGFPVSSSLFTFKDTTNFTEGGISLKLVTDTVPGFPQIGTVPGLISLGTGALVQEQPSFAGIPFTYRPDTLVFDYQYTLGGTALDTAAVFISLTKLDTGIVIETGFALTVSANWTHVVIPLAGFYTASYAPDTLLIQFYASNSDTSRVGSTLLISGLYFGYTTSANTLASTATPGGPTDFCSPGSVTLSANTGTGSSYTYQWYLNGNTIAGANTPQYVAAVSGSYTVLLDSAGVTGTSAAVVVVDSNCTAINAIAAPELSVYPNPASGLLNINSNENLAGYSIEMYDVLGRLVISQVLEGTNNAVNVAKLANGTYIYRITDKQNNVVAQSKFNVIK